MKSFILSTIIFFVLIALCVANTICIHRAYYDITAISNGLTPDDTEGAKKLCSTWDKYKLFFSISIHDSHVDKISELCENIKSAVTLGNGAEFEKNIILLNDLLSEIKENEEISLQGIL